MERRQKKRIRDQSIRGLPLTTHCQSFERHKDLPRSPLSTTSFPFGLSALSRSLFLLWKKSDERRALVPLSRCLIAAWQELSLLEPFSSGLTIQTCKLKWAAWKLHQKLDDLVWQRGSICASFRGAGCCTRGAIVNKKIAYIWHYALWTSRFRERKTAEGWEGRHVN